MIEEKIEEFRISFEKKIEELEMTLVRSIDEMKFSFLKWLLAMWITLIIAMGMFRYL
ncbi:MAG: hypothetical protein AB1546_07255 [bacterium]